MKLFMEIVLRILCNFCVFVCVCEGHFYLTIRAGHRLLVFVNRMLRKASDRSNCSLFQDRDIDVGRRILRN